jgi:hypothetical protein
MVSTINCATIIVALLDEGLKLMANTLCHTFVKTNRRIVVGDKHIYILHNNPHYSIRSIIVVQNVDYVNI